jgi:hypothetical protein
MTIISTSDRLLLEGTTEYGAKEAITIVPPFLPALPAAPTVRLCKWQPSLLSAIIRRENIQQVQLWALC